MGILTSLSATPYKLVSAATTNATGVKGSPGQLHSVLAGNTDTSACYLKLYDKATAPTVGTDTPVQVYPVPASGVVTLTPATPLDFSKGIAFALTTGAADSDTTAVSASKVIVNLGYA